jgi:hypothetical protein
MDVERVDFVSFPAQDILRARRFNTDPDGNAPMLHRRFAA